MAANFLGDSDSGLLAWANNFHQLIGLNFASYGLTSAQSTSFGTKLSAYSDALSTVQTPDSRTRPATEQKNIAKKALVAFARELVRIVQAFPALTDDQRRSLQITVRKTPAPIPAIVIRPGMSIDTVFGRTVDGRVYDATSATKRNKPKNIDGAKIYVFVGTNYPSDPTLWSYMGDFTRTKYSFTVPDSVVSGAKIWVCAAWYRGNVTGPTNMPLSTNIQGGGSNEVINGMKIAA